MMRLFNSRPSYGDRVYAEAQALIDDGLDRELVLELFPRDTEWLEALLDTSIDLIDATRREEPSWYFEGALKRRFIEAGMKKASGMVPMAESTPSRTPQRRYGTAFAAAGVVAGALGAWAIAFGFLTADSAGKGDWNYVFRAGRDRIDYRFSDGPGRVDVRLNATELSVQRIVVLPRSEVTQADLDRLAREADALAQLAQKGPLDKPQQERLKDIRDQVVAVLNEVKERQPDLQPSVDSVVDKVNSAVAAGTGAVKPITPTAASPSPSPSPSATATPVPATPSPSASPATDSSPSPTASATPTASETPAASPSPSP